MGVDALVESIESPRVSNDSCNPDNPTRDCQYATRQRGALLQIYTPLVDPYLTIVVGTRVEFDSTYGFVNVPRLAIRLIPVKRLKLRTSVGQGYRAPTFKELYPD